nr:retrovirus-related Pol polyprotein from transposon TNT 1-94 [Tanacetum cinerariifolium]
MLDKDLYDSWKSQMDIYMQNREHGRMILEIVEHGPLIWPTVEENGVIRQKKYAKLSAAEKIQADCDMKASNIILQGDDLIAACLNKAMAFLTAVASSSSGPGLHVMTPATPSTGLVSIPVSQQPYIPPNRDDWDPAAPKAEVLADSPVSISISQDAPSTSIPSSQAHEHSSIISQGAVDPTLFTRHAGNDSLLVQIYLDNIIFTATDIAMCDEFANQMTNKFKMSMMGKMSFFLGLQISQSLRGIFINQSKYAFEIVKKYGLMSTDSVDMPMIENKKLDEDIQGKPIVATIYRGMIGSLIYLTASRPDLIYVVCVCARYQAKPTKSTYKR